MTPKVRVCVREAVAAPEPFLQMMQANASRTERSDNPYLSTVADYVGASGWPNRNRRGSLATTFCRTAAFGAIRRPFSPA